MVEGNNKRWGSNSQGEVHQIHSHSRTWFWAKLGAKSVFALALPARDLVQIFFVMEVAKSLGSTKFRIHAPY